jgi:hypothetical protein
MSDSHPFLPAEIQDDDRWFTLGIDGPILFCLQICCTCGLAHRVEINTETKQIRFLDVPENVKVFAEGEYRKHSPGRTATFNDKAGAR